MAEENSKVFTSEGFQRLQDELSYLKTTKTAEITERLAEARAQGDLSENSEYDDAKDAQAKNEARIKEIESLLKDAVVLSDDDISKTNVSLGSTVLLRDEETKEEVEYSIVNANEEDIFENRLSVDSPVGKAIVGKKKGATVTVTTPAGAFKYKIVKIGK
jgi:transcription elongation factor GreA